MPPLSEMRYLLSNLFISLMEETMDITMTELPEIINKHLNDVAESFGLEADEDTIARLGAGWSEKKDAFDDSMIEMGMDEIQFFDKDDERGALALTYSGSLISIGPLVDGQRKIDYTSIGFRHDVPASITRDGCVMADDAEIDKSLSFTKGPISKTSPIFKIVACPESLSADEQSELLDEATTIIVETFVDMNKEIIQEI